MAQSERRAAEFGVVSDPGIPTLQTVLGPVTMAEHLRHALPDRCGSVRGVRIQILKRHRTRCTFEIQWPRGDAWRAVIGKVYAADRADVYRAMEAIGRAGFGPDEAFSIPEPLGYIPELHLLLLEKVAGTRAKQVLLTSAEADRVDTAERCAHWLARFHAVAPRLGQPYRVTDVLDSLDEWLQPFRDCGDVLANRAKRLREQLEAAARGLEPGELCAGHGHYTSGQVIIAERRPVAVDSGMRHEFISFDGLVKDRTVTFDWDGHDVADPCRDLACFVVDLKRLAWKNPVASASLDHAAEVFLKTYFSVCLAKTGGNLPFYAAARCLRLARRDIGDQAADKAAAMLDEGLRVVEQGLSSWSEDL
jgi:aminoglycoside phosphotransferase (APT) family kinase protein